MQTGGAAQAPARVVKKSVFALAEIWNLESGDGRGYLASASR
jgi:hypothetical protein